MLLFEKTRKDLGTVPAGILSGVVA
jgi:hypothetical protein